MRDRKLILSMCAAPALGLLLAVASAAAQDRVVIAIDPPSDETNLFWMTTGAFMLPWAQGLVGEDAATGEYDQSGLAHSWEQNDDATVWTFHLHENAEFHHGWGPVTAADVVHSYELHTAEDSRMGAIEQLRGAEVVAVDDHTVEFRYEEPHIGFPFLHAGRGIMVIYSKAQYEAEGLDGYHSKPAGTAPYQYLESGSGAGLVIERVENHWSGFEPDFEQIEFRWIPEPGTKLAALLAGEAHIASLPAELHEDATGSGMEIVRSRNFWAHFSNSFMGLYLKSDDPAFNPGLPFTDIRVREAMNRAIDREAMIDVVFGGAERAEPIVRWGMKEGHEGYNPELAGRFEEMYGYDPDRARELLAEAGYPDAFDDPEIRLYHVTLAGGPYYGPMVELLQVFLDEIGMQTRLVSTDRAATAAMHRGREGDGINPTRNAPIRPTQTGLLTYFKPTGFQLFEDDTIDKMVDDLVVTFDPEERDRIAREAWTYLFEQYSDMPLAAVRSEVVVNPDVVSDWVFPGVTSAGISHYHLIEKAE